MPNAVQTPLLMKTAGGLYISLFEAALVNYPAMNLLVDFLYTLLDPRIKATIAEGGEA